MALADLLSNLVQTGTQAVSAYDAGQARRRGREAEDLMLRSEHDQARAQQELKAALQARQMQSMDLADALTQGRIDQMAFDQANPKPRAPVMGSPEWLDAIEGRLKLERRYDRPRAERSQDDLRQSFLQKTIADLMRPRANPLTGAMGPGMSAEEAQRQALSTWEAIQGAGAPRASAPAPQPVAARQPAVPQQESTATGPITLSNDSTPINAATQDVLTHLFGGHPQGTATPAPPPAQGNNLQQMWDEAAAELQADGMDGTAVVEILGPRP